MKKILLAILIMILFPAYCLAQGEGSFAIVEWNANKVVILDFSGNVLSEKEFNGIGVCYFISPNLGGWLVKGCLHHGCQGEDWILWQLQSDGSISNTITGLGPGPFYTGITSGNFITGDVYTGSIDLRNENGMIIDSINVWEEENGWPFNYNRLGDTAGLVTGGFVVPPEGGWPRSSASYAPYLYYYDENLTLTNKVDITAENIRLFNLIGVTGGGFAGTCADYGSSELVESLCWFDSEGSLIEKVDVRDDLPYLQYMNVFIAGLSDGRVMLTVYGHDTVWMYEPPSDESGLSSMEATTAGRMAANYPKALDLSRSGISAIGAIAGNTFAIDSDDDAVPDVADNCPKDTNPNQEDSDGDGIGNVCDFNTTTSIYSSTTTTTIFRDCMLYVNVSPPEGGTTSPSPPQYFIMGCQPVTIEALPNPGYAFSHWEGDAQDSDNPVMIEGGGNRSITAIFTPENTVKDDYQLNFFSLTPCEIERFKSGVIEMDETDGMFSLTLFSEGNPDGTTYADCPYEAYGDYQTMLFVGNPPQELDGARFTIMGVIVGNRFLVGFFQFRLVTELPVECSYLFWGRTNTRE